MAEISVRDVGIKSIIDSIRPHQLLWNPEDEDYKNKFKKSKAWRAIAKSLQIPETTAKAKWKNIKDVFRKELHKRPTTRLEEYEGTWQYFHSLWFLYRPEELSTNKSYNNDDNNGSYNNDDNNGSYNNDDNTEGNNRSYNDCSNNNNDKEQYIKLEPAEKTEVFFVNEDALSDRLDDEFDQEPAAKRTKTEEDDDYDMMFLKSLAPYFRALRPIKKLSVRNRIQELLLEELNSQT